MTNRKQRAILLSIVLGTLVIVLTVASWLAFGRFDHARATAPTPSTTAQPQLTQALLSPSALATLTPSAAPSGPQIVRITEPGTVTTEVEHGVTTTRTAPGVVTTQLRTQTQTATATLNITTTTTATRTEQVPVPGPTTTVTETETATTTVPAPVVAPAP